MEPAEPPLRPGGHGGTTAVAWLSTAPTTTKHSAPVAPKVSHRAARLAAFTWWWWGRRPSRPGGPDCRGRRKRCVTRPPGPLVELPADGRLGTAVGPRKSRTGTLGGALGPRVARGPVPPSLAGNPGGPSPGRARNEGGGGRGCRVPSYLWIGRPRARFGGRRLS